MPKCHLKNPNDGEREEIRYLYEIANVLKGFLEERGFTAEYAGGVKESDSPLLSDAVRPYYRDYIAHVDPDGYRSLHITFFDNSAKCYMEMQLRTNSSLQSWMSICLRRSTTVSSMTGAGCTAVG